MAKYLWYSLLLFSHVVAEAAGASNSCRYIPGDAGWPIQREWARLNATVGGRLIATIPVAHVCHKAGTFAAFDATKCAELGKTIEDADTASTVTLCSTPGEIFNPYWQNDTCSPFTSPKAPCELGNRVVYSINVTGPGDVQAGLKFATEKNIRLVIKNTGIDYLGKSTGQGALALWMYNLKASNVIADYQGPSYRGPAVKLAAGVIAGEAYQTVREAGYRIVAPECGLVGFTGGYIQSGGQSQLITAYGLAADQVLEWEVVTPQGEYLVATPKNNTDIYWALAGGGGGTYGVVLSTTIRAFPEGPVAGGQMVAKTTNSTALWEAVETWYSQAPSFVNHSRDNIQFFATNDTLEVFSFTMPDQRNSSIDKLLTTFIPELNRLDIPYNLTTTNYPSYLDNFVTSYGPLPYGDLCPSFPVIASRLIPRSTVLNKTTNKNLMNDFRRITDGGTWWIGCSLFNVDDSPGSPRPAHPPNAINPAWREAVAYCNPQTHQPYSWKNPETDEKLTKQLVNEIFPSLEADTPGSGVLNEIPATYKGNWKETFYGANYDRLLRIKHAYDPNYMMYGLFAVGSDEFTFDSEGRLCRH